MAGYLQLIGYTFLVYCCIYSIVTRICKCIEHHTQWKYRTRVDFDRVRNHPPRPRNNEKEEDQNVRRERDSM